MFLERRGHFAGHFIVFMLWCSFIEHFIGQETRWDRKFRHFFSQRFLLFYFLGALFDLVNLFHCKVYLIHLCHFITFFRISLTLKHLFSTKNANFVFVIIIWMKYESFLCSLWTVWKRQQVEGENIFCPTNISDCPHFFGHVYRQKQARKCIHFVPRDQEEKKSENHHFSWANPIVI